MAQSGLETQTISSADWPSTPFADPCPKHGRGGRQRHQCADSFSETCVPQLLTHTAVPPFFHAPKRQGSVHASHSWTWQTLARCSMQTAAARGQFYIMLPRCRLLMYHGFVVCGIRAALLPHYAQNMLHPRPCPPFGYTKAHPSC